MSYLAGDSLLVRIRIAFGASIAADPSTWTWTDVTDWWHVPDSVSITWGRSARATQAETSTLSLTLKNTDGRFTAYDPRSPYWPHVRKWTPISYDVDLGDEVGWRNRFSGFVRKWPLTWPGKSSRIAFAPIEAVGVLGRLRRGKPLQQSPMRRTLAAEAAVVAYWPAEDWDGAAVAGSAIAGHQPLTVTGGLLRFADVNGLVEGGDTWATGTKRLADISGGAQLFASVPPDVTAATSGMDGWSASVAVQLYDVTFITGDVVLLDVDTPGGTYVRWRLVAQTAQIPETFGMWLYAYTAAGVETTVLSDGGITTSFVHQNFSVWQDGANISVGYRWFSSGTWSSTGSVPGTLAGVTRLTVNTAGATSTQPVPIGHFAVWQGHPYAAPGGALDGYSTYPGGRLGVFDGWTYETAHLRLARLCAEDRIGFTAPTVSDGGEIRMGPQQPGTSLSLYQRSEGADGGLIFESGFGLGYLPRAVRYNAPVALAIDGDAGQLGLPFEPIDDDQLLRNSWTVERINGSSAVAADQESINHHGEIPDSASLNLADDGRLPDHAAWRLRLTTVQEPRYPAVSINLAASRELAADYCTLIPGSRIQVVNPPEQNVPGAVDQLVVGASETYRGRRSWRATLNTEPASPWQVAEVDGDARVASDGSTLAAELSAAAPATLNSNPYFETDASGWYNNAGEGSIARSTAQAHEGSASLLVTPDGVSSGAYARSVAATGVAPGQVLFGAAWVRCAVTRSVRLRIDWRDGAGAFLSATSTDIAVSADVWTYVWLLGTAPASTAQAGITALMTGTPPITDLLHVDEALLRTTVTMSLASTAANGPWTTDVADFPLDVNVGGERITLSAIAGTTSPQTPTISDRAIAMTHPAGTTVDVWQPAVVPL